MARHWSAYVTTISERQAYALDKIAEKHGHSDGRSLLCELGDYSMSKLSKVDSITMRHLLDRAFALPDPEQCVTSAYVTADGDRHVVTIDGHSFTFAAETWAQFRKQVTR